MRAALLACAAAGLVAGGCAGSGRVSMPSTMVRPAPAPRAAWRAAAPRLFVLPSGMSTAVAEGAGLPLVHVTAMVKAGSALDGEREGIAAATAAMLVEGGAGVRSGPELAEALEQLGDELTVEVEADVVLFHLATPRRGLQRALALLSDVLMRPRFDEEAWRRERARRVAELHAQGDEPELVAERVFRRALFGRHPYGHDPMGTAATVARLDAADLRAFYAANYGPRSTALLLVGDLDDGVGPLLAASFEAWSGGPSVAPPPPPPAPAPPPRLVLVDRPGAAQTQIRVGGVGVGRASPDYPSLILLDSMLGGSFTSRLMQNLRERRGLTYSVDAHLEIHDGTGPVVVRTAVRTDGTALAVGEILAELRGLREAAPEAELRKGRAVIEGRLIEEFATGAGASRLLAAALGHGAGPQAFSRLTDELSALEPPRLAQDAARLLVPEHMVVAVVGDRAAIESSLAALPGRAPLELVDEDGEPLGAGAGGPATVPAPPRRTLRDP